MAEFSNPFLVARTMFKILGIKTGKLYELNEYLFAITFLSLRAIFTGFLLIVLYEADNVLYWHKTCVAVVYFIQLFWCYRILELICERFLKKGISSLQIFEYRRR